MSTLVNAVQVYLRAGWSLGNVKDRYIFAGPGGDQVVGRAVAGLPTTTTDFALLPPRFLREDLDIIKHHWRALHPNYDQFPPGLQKAFPFLVASIIYHEDYIRREWYENHPIFACNLFQIPIFENRTTIDFFRSRIVTGIFHCRNTGLRASGIPPTILVLYEVNQVKESLSEMWKFIKENVVTEITSVKEVCQSLSTSLPTSILNVIYENNHTIDGAPLNMASLKEMFSCYQSSQEHELRNFMERITEMINEKSLATMTATIISSDTSDSSEWSCFHWNGQFRWVPEGYIFKSKNILDSWNLWFYGDTDKRIKPMKEMFMQKRHFMGDLVKKSCKEAFSRLAFVMKRCELKIREKGSSIPKRDDIENSNALRMDIVSSVLREVYDPNGTMNESEVDGFYDIKMNRVTTSTLANIMTRKKEGTP